MSHTPHHEKHFSASETIRDIVIGTSDGLTVPFALAAGLSGAVTSSHLIITAGVAEIAAGAIAMGLGGYLAAKTDAEHFHSELAREQRETIELPHEEANEVRDIFRSYGLDETAVNLVSNAIMADEKRWVDFMMKFELGIDRPDPRRALTSAVTIAASYVVGGLIPLSPYLVMQTVHEALLASIAVTLIALFSFGYIKGKFTVAKPMKSALQTLAVGGLAAGAAYTIAKLVS